MTKTSAEYVSEFFLGFLPDLLPKPLDSAVKSTVDILRGEIDSLIAKPRLRKELLEAAQKAESDFRSEARKKLSNDELIQAVASFPIFDNELFQKTLVDLPEHLNEEFLAKDLQKIIDNDWKGRFTPSELREGAAIYLNCLRVQLLKVDSYVDLVTRLATLRTDSRSEQILVIVNETLALIKKNFGVDSIKFIPGSAPLPPSLVIGREDDIRILKERLISQKSDSTNLQVLTAIRGWPGVGKTTLASVLANDQQIIDKYPDGILWISLGPEPDIHSGLATWGRALGIDDLIKEKTAEDASRRLSAILRNKQMLLIIDDVWKEAQAIPFKVGGQKCATLITTRANDVAQYLAETPENIYRLNVLTEEKSLDLLKEIAPTIVKDFIDACKELVRELEGLPLALQVAGHLLNAEANYGFSVIDLLKELQDGKKILEAKAPADRSDLANETIPTVAVLFQKSTDRLDEFTRDCFAYLGVFAPKPATFDLEAMKSVWQVEDPKPIIRTLVDRGLLEPIPAIDRYQMHALLVAHAKAFLE